MSNRRTVAVVGATGRLGEHVVRVLAERGHEVVAISRSAGVDIVTGEGLDEALTGADVVIDTSGTPSADETVATEFFTAAAANLHAAGARAGVELIVSVSILGIDASTGGYYRAKVAHEKALTAGPLPVRILRAAQFHEFVEPLVSWGRQGDTVYVPLMRTQLVAAAAVAEALVDLAEGPVPEPGAEAPFPELAGPREENLAKAAELVYAARGEDVTVVEVSEEGTPDRELLENGAFVAGPATALAGPTLEEWLAQS
ncbi:SDR family oxidoreductase [Kitasatospora purpeofusca]|uniref:NAD(P)H-binding protein n=1 Tax=Kitasatospora purpeofusca TaxID=67352 RepID=A0ABZ1UAQ8_9ACTN|nr:NAD(P)H-binding protein [Kitasatospora purpeofusca]